jgi:hypothetical protein
MGFDVEESLNKAYFEFTAEVYKLCAQIKKTNTDGFFSNNILLSTTFIGVNLAKGDYFGVYYQCLEIQNWLDFLKNNEFEVSKALVKSLDNIKSSAFIYSFFLNEITNNFKKKLKK